MSSGVAPKQRLLRIPERQRQQLACCCDSSLLCSLVYPLQALGIRRGGEVWGLPTGPHRCMESSRNSGSCGGRAAQFYHFMCVVVWPVCSYSCAWFPWRPEEGVESGTEVTDDFEPPCGCQESNPGSLEEYLSPFLQPTTL